MTGSEQIPAPVSNRRVAWISLALIFITFALYWPVRNFEFLEYDDGLYVAQNPVIQKGLTLEGLKWAFEPRHASNWHPLTWLSHMLDCQLFGLDAGLHHLVNVLWHAANVALLFLLLVRLTNRLGSSFAVAALFAWHPMHIESVAWIAERKDVLSSFFWLLTTHLYVSYSRQPTRTRYGFVIAAFAVGILSKPMIVTLPCALLLMDVWPLRRVNMDRELLASLRREWPKFKTLLIEKMPLFVLSGVLSVMTFRAQRPEAMSSIESIGLMARIANALIAYVLYVWKLFWPAKLAVFYPYQFWNGWLAVAAAAALIFITIVFWRRVGEKPYLIVGWFWFLGTLVPAIGLVQVGDQAMADRYSYLPSIGISLIVVWSIADWLQQHPEKQIMVVGMATAALIGCLALTAQLLPVWANTLSLFRHAAAVIKGNAFAHLKIGVQLSRANQNKAAEVELREAVRINPGLEEAQFNLALILAREQDLKGAAEYFKSAFKLNPSRLETSENLGSLLAVLGDLAGAAYYFKHAMTLEPGSASFRYQLGQIEIMQGQTKDGIFHLAEALRLDPGWIDPPLRLAWVLSTHVDPHFRDGRAAIRFAERACMMTREPGPAALDVLAAAYAEAGRFDDAVAAARRAMEAARAAKSLELEQAIGERLRLYEKRQPYRIDPTRLKSDFMN